MDLWIKYKLVISKWFTTEVAVSRTLGSMALSSMSEENVVLRAPIRTVLPLLFSPAHNLVLSIGMFVSFCNYKTYRMVKTLKKIEPGERISRIVDASNNYSDSNMTHKINQEHFRERKKSREPTVDQVLHSFATIIRNDIAKVEVFTEHEPTLADASLSHSFHSILKSLIKLPNWVTNDKAFNAGGNLPEVQTGGLRKCLELTECIVTILLCLRLFFLTSPYKYIASLTKKIQKLLNSNGMCASYTELRRFLTSVANHEIEHIHGDRYIPSWIRITLTLTQKW